MVTQERNRLNRVANPEMKNDIQSLATIFKRRVAVQPRPLFHQWKTAKETPLVVKIVAKIIALFDYC